MNEVRGRRERAAFCQAFVMHLLHSTPSTMRGAPSSRHCSTMCLAFHVSRSDKESEIACATKNTTPAKRQSRSGGDEWASRAGKVMMAAAPRLDGGPRGSAVGFVVARAASRLLRGFGRKASAASVVRVSLTGSGLPWDIAPAADGARCEGLAGREAWWFRRTLASRTSRAHCRPKPALRCPSVPQQRSAAAS